MADKKKRKEFFPITFPVSNENLDDYPEVTIDDGTPEGAPEPEFDLDDGGGYSDEDDSVEATPEEEEEMFGDLADLDDLPDDLMPDYSDLGPADPIGDDEDEE